MKTLQLKLSNLGAVFLVLITFSILTISCREQEHKPVEEDIPDPKIVQKVKEQIVSNDEVFKLFRNNNEKINVINEYIRRAHGRSKFNDTRTIYFDFKVLQEYLNLIEEISKKHSIEPQGIKVVLGAEGSTNKEYPYQTNVLFVPTTENNGIQSAYTTQKGKIVFFKNIKPKDTTKKMNVQEGSFLSTSLLIQDDGLALNGGRPIPPPNNDDPDFD